MHFPPHEWQNTNQHTSTETNQGLEEKLEISHSTLGLKERQGQALANK